MDQDKLRPRLDEATTRIARTLLSTPPKPHEEMKIGKIPGAVKPKRGPRPKLGAMTSAERTKKHRARRKQGKTALDEILESKLGYPLSGKAKAKRPS
jgi:hypothetical protein